MRTCKLYRQNDSKNLVSFVYTNKKGETAVRPVFVMNQTDTVVEGFDLDYLDTKDQKALCSLLKNHRISSQLSKEAPKENIPGLDPRWFKAWRRYNRVTSCDNDCVVSIYNEAKKAFESGKAVSESAARDNIHKAIRRNGTAYGVRYSICGDGWLSIR